MLDRRIGASKEPLRRDETKLMLLAVSRWLKSAWIFKAWQTNE